MQETVWEKGSKRERAFCPMIQGDALRVGLLRRFWRAYVTALDKHPIAVKSATSFFGFMIGDLLAQTITGHGAYDLFRTLRLVSNTTLQVNLCTVCLL